MTVCVDSQGKAATLPRPTGSGILSTTFPFLIHRTALENDRHDVDIPGTGSLLLALRARDVRGSVPLNLGLEVAEADPLRAPVEVHLGDGHGAPLTALCHDLAGVVEDGGDHPVARH